MQALITHTLPRAEEMLVRVDSTELTDERMKRWKMDKWGLHKN